MEFLKDEVFILFKRPADAPFSREDEEIVSAVVLNPFCIGIKCERGGDDVFIFDPTDVLLRHRTADDVNTVFVL